MRIFITGATGFVGREILRQLTGTSHTIRILQRKNRGRDRLGDLPGNLAIEVHPGDVTDAASLRGALQEVDAVLHLVGIISENRPGAFEAIHWRGTENVLAAAGEAGTRRIIHMSALGTRPNASSRYHQTKWAAEEAVRRSGLDYTIFRPSLIFGPEDHFVNLFAKLSRFSPFLPVMGSGQARVAPMAVRVAGAAFVRALEARQTLGRTLDLCGPETLSFNEVMDQILSVLGRRRLKLHVPLGLARLQAALLEWIYPRLLRRAPPLNRDQLIMLQEDNVGSGQEAEELLRLEQVRFHAGIAEYLGRRGR